MKFTDHPYFKYLIVPVFILFIAFLGGLISFNYF